MGELINVGRRESAFDWTKGDFLERPYEAIRRLYFAIQQGRTGNHPREERRDQLLRLEDGSG